MNAEFWQEPLALPPERELLVALSPTMGNYVEAFGPVAIDAEDEQSFLDRWLGLFARGAVGKLRPPNQMPPPASFWESD